MTINCRSCQRNKELPVALALYWQFRHRILFCLDCVPDETQTMMQAENEKFWTARTLQRS